MDDGAVVQRAQPVVAQRLPGRDQVGDEVGVADGRGDFQRPLGVDERERDVVAGQKVGSEVGEFCCHPQRPGQGTGGQVGHRVHCLPRFRHSQGQVAMAKVERLVEHEHGAIVTLALGHHVHPGDAKVHAAIAHADHDVAGALEEDGQAGQGRDVGGVLAWVGLVHLQAAGGQKIQRGLGHTALAGQ